MEHRQFSTSQMFENGQSRIPTNVELPYMHTHQHQPEFRVPSHNPFLHHSVARSFRMSPENYHPYQMPSTTRRGSYKRKSPGAHYYDGSSSDLSFSLCPLRQRNPGMDAQRFFSSPMAMTPGSRANALPSLRNVSRRSSLDLESNLPRTPLSSDPLTPLSAHVVFPPPCWGAPVADLHRETDRFLTGSNARNGSVDIQGHCRHDWNLGQNLQGSSLQFSGGIYSGSYSQRFIPTLGNSRSRMSDEDSHTVAENFSSRCLRPLHVFGRRNGETVRRSRVSSDEHPLFSAGDQLTSEVGVGVDRHGDMRLDIDNMNYEELVALGERIGSVNTGLSEDAISNCLTTPGWSGEGGSCVICLEAYGKMDDIGRLKVCGHGYHGWCIRRWLSLKNTCPICKTCAAD